MKNNHYIIGIVGFGGMASWHKEIIQTIDELEIGGVYDIKEERRTAATQLGLKTFESLESLLTDKTIDFILIATPNHMHKPIAIQAMKSGKHVVSEKPVTLSSKDLEEMITVSKETGMFLTVHQNRRWDEDYLIVKKIIEENKLGEIYQLESRVHGSRGIPGDWRQEKEFGGGMVLDWGVHLLDQILLLQKGKKCLSVYATLTHITNQVVDDGFSAQLRFEDGITAIVEVGTSNFISLPRWYILGQDGTTIIEDFEKNGKIVRAASKNEKDVIPVKTASGLTKTMAPRRLDSIFTEELPEVTSDIRDFYKNVIKVISGKEEPLIKLEEVKRVMKLMEAIFQSGTKHQVISFEGE